MQGEEHASVAMSHGDESKLRNLVRLGRATSEKRLLSQALSSRSGGSSGGGARAIAAAVNAARSSEEAGEAGRKRRGGIALADGGVATAVSCHIDDCDAVILLGRHRNRRQCR